MRVTYDPDKRSKVLERNMDMAEAGAVFGKFHLTRKDDKHSEAEERFVSIGLLDEDVVLIVWTPRPGSRRIVTMWKANEKERAAYFQQRDRSG